MPAVEPGSLDVGDQLELAMGLVSNAADWRLAGPPTLDAQCADWVRAAQRWLATYQAWLRQHLELIRQAAVEEAPPSGAWVSADELAQIREAATAVLPALQAHLAADGPAAAPEGGNTGQGRTEALSADLAPEAGSRFALLRHEDPSGVSGTGVVAWGIVWPDGSVSLRWRGARPSSVYWNSFDDAMATHGQGGRTEAIWLDPQPISQLPVDKITAGTLQAELRLGGQVQ